MAVCHYCSYLKSSFFNLTDFIFHKPTIKNIKKDDTEDLPVNVFSPADEKGKPVCGEATDPTVFENAQILLPEDNIDMLEGHKVCEENTNDIKINSKADMPEAEKNNFYSFPPLSLLKEGESSGSLETNAYGKANRLETTLKSFGVNAKIVHVSLGPAVDNPDILEKLMLAGMDVARINFSHSTEENSNEILSVIKETEMRLIFHYRLISQNLDFSL